MKELFAAIGVVLFVILGAGAIAWGAVAFVRALNRARSATIELEHETGVLSDRILVLHGLIETMTERMVEIAEAGIKTTEAILKTESELHANLAGVPKMLEAMAAIGKVQGDHLAEFKLVAVTLRDVFVGKDRKRGFIPPDQDAADREYQIQKLIEQTGITRGEAEDQVNQTRAWDMFSLEG